MTNPTLERAARALIGHWFDNNDHGPMVPVKQPWGDLSPKQRAYAIGQARAVLMAVREPDEAMVKAAEDREEEIVGTYGCADPAGGFETDGPKICFTAMIDAILAPEWPVESVTDDLDRFKERYIKPAILAEGE